MRTIAKHIGVFCIIVALVYVLIRFGGLPPEFYYAIPPVFLAYLGLALFMGPKN